MARKGRGCLSVIWKIAASIVTICVCKVGLLSLGNAERNGKVPLVCGSDHQGSSPASKSFLMLVSTVDGKLTALNVQDKGAVAWSVESALGPLISSSLSKMEIQRNGAVVRLVPALDGVLYQYDGESIEAMPITAETLLSSSHKVSDDTVVVGGKETQTYGLDAMTGKLQYVCAMDGCKYFGEHHVTDADDIIVVKRNVKTVRAVECRTGGEKWNFSVGQHDVQFLPGLHVTTGQESDLHNTDPDTGDLDNDDVSINVCASQDDAVDGESIPTRDNTLLNVVVPTGQIMAMSKAGRAVLWKHTFESPIARAWTLDKGQLEPISIFDSSVIPALTSSESDEATFTTPPLLYLGTYLDQVYVQSSDFVTETLERFERDDDISHLHSLRVLWRPYLATAPSRTPILRGVHLPAITHVPPFNSKGDNRDVQVWTDDYPYDVGYYLYPDTSPVFISNESSSVNAGDITLTLWNWWKEVAAISLLTSVLFHLVITRYLHRPIQALETCLSIDNEGADNPPAKYDIFDEVKRSSESQDEEYLSIYAENFEHVRTLGSGGFGVVFEARKRMEDVNYAVKRIPIHLTDEAKEKSLREVRTLAKLDHSGIVSYKNSWIESPPIGWQESHDMLRQQAEGITSTSTHITHDPTTTHNNPTNDQFSIDIPSDSSKGFIIDRCNDESGSFSFGRDGSIDHDDTMFPDNLETSESFADICANIKNNKNTNKSSHIDSDNVNINNKNLASSPNDQTDSFIVFEDSGCENIDDQKFTNDHFILPVSGDTSKLSQSSNEPMKRQRVCQRHYLFIQMQLCQRETLKDWLASNTLNRERDVVLDIFYQIVTAVDYVHGNGFIHRDLKPSNIFFSMDGVVKIGDFGLVTANVAKTDDNDTVASGQGETDQHTAQVGTSLYMSPEQITGEVYSSKVDIYSLGLILFELFYPFGTEMERYSTLTGIKKCVYPPRFVREMPKEHKIVEWLLSLNVDDRPAAGDVLNHDLLQAYRPQRTVNLSLRPRTSSDNSH